MASGKVMASKIEEIGDWCNSKVVVVVVVVVVVGTGLVGNLQSLIWSNSNL
jgi:hypothetical protein